MFFLGCLLYSIGWYLFSRLDENISMWQAVPAGVFIEFGMMIVFPATGRPCIYIPGTKPTG